MNNKQLPQLASKLNCTGCMACVGTCNVGALSMRIAEDGHGYPELNANKCVGCLRCEKVCKTSLSCTGNNLFAKSIPNAVWANDESLRRKSTSGGFATAASKWMINQNKGVVVGASFDGRRASHVLIDDDRKLDLLQGSKYVWSDTSRVYKDIAENLKTKPVLFIGTGCQVAGVLSFFYNHPNKDRLFTIDLICGGVPSDLLIQVFFKTHPEVTSIISFRSKRKYELKGLINNQEMILPKQSLPLSGFYAEQTMRYSCYNCPFAFAHRASDLTIGDLWGDCSPAEEREKGVSLVVTHSDKGHRLLNEVDVTFRQLDWHIFLFSNKRLVYGHTKLTRMRKNLARNFQCMNEDSFSRLYSLSSSLKHPIVFIQRVYIFLIRKVYNCISDNFIKTLFKTN